MHTMPKAKRETKYFYRISFLSLAQPTNNWLETMTIILSLNETNHDWIVFYLVFIGIKFSFDSI